MKRHNNLDLQKLGELLLQYFQHIPTIQFSGPQPGWGRTRHCTAGGRRCPWRRWRWWAIRHRPNLRFYTTTLAPNSAHDVAMLLSKSFKIDILDCGGWISRLQGEERWRIPTAIFFWTSIQQKTLTSTCHHSVPCDFAPHLQQQARREGASSNSLPSRWWRLRNLIEKFPMSQCGWTPWRSFLRTCLLTFHDFIAYIKNKENKSTSNLQYSFVLSGPDTTHHQATINEQECVECQKIGKAAKKQSCEQKSQAKKKPIPVFKSSGFTGGQLPHQLVLKII